MEKENKVTKTNLSRRKITEYFALDKFNADNNRLDDFSEQVEIFAERMDQELPTKATKDELQEAKEEIDKKDKAQDAAIKDITDKTLPEMEGSFASKVNDLDKKVDAAKDNLEKEIVAAKEAASTGLSKHTATKASKTTLGHVKVGDGITLSTDGTISVEVGGIEPATPSKIGGIKVGSGLSVKSDGTLSTDKKALIETIDEHATTKFDMDGKTYKYGFELNSDKDGLVFVYEEDK